MNMALWLFQVLLLLHFSSYTTSSILPLCNPDDSFALLQFQNSLVVNTSESPYWCKSQPSKTESWENGSNCCLWDGVTCDNISSHVIGLDLSCSYLIGELHHNSTLFHLTHLQHLNLASNDFFGSSIYSGIGHLVSLTHLNLSDSSFFGDIPSELSQLSKLLSLDLSYNYGLRLDASTWNKFILNATNLQELVLDNVDMISIKEGSLSLLMNLSSLVSLQLSGTGLQGNFPMEVLRLPNIQELSLEGNDNLIGELPKSNWSVPLRFLDLSWTNFSGQIPDSIGHLKSLQVLRLGICQLEGIVPPSFWNLTQLTDLDLSGNNLNCEIFSSVSNLKYLVCLNLAHNNFKSHIPDVFYNFTQLKIFQLSFNNLEGQLPLSLFNLTQLTFLSLEYNKLEGPIPNKITELSKLEQLHLNQNLLNGTIPHWCYSLSSLIWLALSNNKFTGSIGEFSTSSLLGLNLSNNRFEGKFPSSVFELQNLTFLYLSSTNLAGCVNFHQFSKLKYLYLISLSNNNFLSININDSVDYILPELHTLYLSSCNITKVPKFIARLQNLQYLDLSNNNIYGKIPRWFKDNLLLSWKYIEYIDLSFNKLQGYLPILPNGIGFFSVSNNDLTGDISSALCNASSLRILNLSHNNFTGIIPQCLGTFPSLDVLDLQMNNLYGGIPDNIPKTNSFKTIKLNGNLLEGPLPRSFAYCTTLEVLDLGSNHIQDIFPNWLETLSNLQVLILRSNQFYGILTSFSTKLPFPKLRIFDVSGNNLSGPLPISYLKNFQAMKNVNDNQSDLEYMSRLINYSVKPYNDSVVVIMKGLSMELERILTTFITIDFSSNKFEGEIPQVIGELNSLKGLNLSHNAITGTILQSLGNLRSLEWLDMSWNQLNGEIPMALTNLNFLSVLNLSQNHLEGFIPKGKQFNTFQNDSFGGNPMLCGSPLSKSCSHEEEPSTFNHEEKFEFGWKCVVLGYACGVVFGMLLGYCFFFCRKLQWLARLVGMPKRDVKRTDNRVNANRRRMN